MKTILVPIANSEEDNAALKTAFAVGRLFGSHLECRLVRPSAVLLALRAMPHGDAGKAVGEALAERWEEFKKDAGEAAGKAHRSFTGLCQRNEIPIVDSAKATKNVSATWYESEGDPLETSVSRAWFNELVVLGRSQFGNRSAVDFIGELLMRSGRPILIASAEVPKDPARSIVVAWKPDAQAARAVTAALPFLQKAAKVTIVTAAEGGLEEETAKHSASELADSLIWNGIKAGVHIVVEVKRNPYEAILAEATTQKASLLVMGAYGHSRTREFVFGGFTRQALEAAPLPILLAH